MPDALAEINGVATSASARSRHVATLANESSFSINTDAETGSASCPLTRSSSFLSRCWSTGTLGNR